MITLTVDSEKKVYKIEASGMLKANEVEDLLKQLEESARKYDPKQYILVIDAREQKAFTPETVPYLEKAMKFYTETPFKKRVSVVLDSAIAMQQVKRVSKDEVGQFVMVSSLEEAYKNV